MAEALVLVRRASTRWDALERVVGQTLLPGDETSLAALREKARENQASAPLAGVFCYDKDPALASGHAVADAIGVPLWQQPALQPLDMGVWSGLSWMEVRDRFGRIYRRWHAAPHCYAPPCGETLGEVVARVRPLCRKLAGVKGRLAVVADDSALLALLIALRGEDELEKVRTPWELLTDSTWMEIELPEGGK
jgi:broad specificity phosphatase PhoE